MPIFKKGTKNDPKNYRSISLLSSISKIFTKILSQKVISATGISDEQQGFRKNWSTIDGIFIIRQLIEGSIEYDKPLYLCFVDFTQAFDRVRLNDVLKTLRNNHVNENIITIIKELNTNTKTKINIRGNLTEEIPIMTGIRQSDSLSPSLFNLIMEQIIKSVRDTGIGYEVGNCRIPMVCYTDDVVLTAESEDDLQRLLFRLNNIAKMYMKISIQKTIYGNF